MIKNNYITSSGLNKLREELKQLLQVIRPEITKTVTWAASNGDRSENADYQYGKKKLREIDSRIKFLTQRIDQAVEIIPEQINSSDVKIGATVTIEDQEGNEKIYRIVGVDEVDVKQGKISWRSPLGESLLKHKEGDSVSYSAPAGKMEVNILKIQYLRID